jgi:hypothetical protein
MNEKLPTCCQYHGIDCSAGQGRACPGRAPLPAPEDMESIAWAVATVALALALGAPFVWFCVENWPLILMAFT